METENNDKMIYRGEWQWGEVIRQQLEGPIGDGEALYPCGDRFKGFFHLSYAGINGPAYAAEGSYTMADGSYIEHAWINTSKERKPEYWGLHGVYRVHHPAGADTITMFCHGGKRYGFELVLDGDRPRAIEWYAGEALRELEVTHYEIDESNADCVAVELTLNVDGDTYRVRQQGGRYTYNQYDDKIYEPWVSVTIYLPNGDNLDHYGSSVRLLRPYDGYVTMHCAATGKCRSELWTTGALSEAREWKYDTRSARELELPVPIFGSGGSGHARVWADGHIEYDYGIKIYDGEIANDMPEGRGVLTDDEGGRYEGEFHEGRCHGQGKYVNERTGFSREGTWERGEFREANVPAEPIVLRARHGHKHWSVGSDGEWEYEESKVEAAVGQLGSFRGYGGLLKVIAIEAGRITITFEGRNYELTPGEGVIIHSEIEGREWSDGCVYDGDDYALILTWKE